VERRPADRPIGEGQRDVTEEELRDVDRERPGRGG
jgi:hypothetical protein